MIKIQNSKGIQKHPPIIIQNNCFKKIPDLIKNCGRDFVIVTDKNLEKLGKELLGNMRRVGVRCHMILLPPGEQTKTLSFVEKITSSFLKFSLKRDGCLIALGGGVIGDLTGFIASIYTRGIAYISVPTTLLAMGDSSIGGKTGIDLTEGKNLLGTFYNPKMVIMDPLLLKNLPQRDFQSGLAEIIKHAIIADRTFFIMLEKHVNKILQKNPQFLKKIIQRSISIKMNIIKKDEQESLEKIKKGISRMLLNYGHTVGHALEKLSNFSITHGYAVSIGMVAENRIAVGKKLLKERDAERIETLLEKLYLPTKIPEQYGAKEIEKTFRMDKKHVDGKLYFSLPIKIGEAKIVSFD